MSAEGSSSTASASDQLAPCKIADAWKIVQPMLLPTHLLRSSALDEISGFQVWLKPENLQRTGSYKIRGASYKLHQLKEQGGQHKVIAASAGNHAQGVAYAARELGMDCVIVMPERAPLPKRRATERYGAKVMLVGDCFDDSLAYALKIAPAEKRDFISPYNDIEIITGQATLGWEVLEEMKDNPPDAILVPVGGAGLIAGVAAIAKQICPQTRIIAIQSSCAPAFLRSWYAYRQKSEAVLPLDVPTQETIADGVRVRHPGEICWHLCKDLVDAALQVDDVQIYQGILFLLEQAKLVSEGAGALGVAALLHEAGVKPGSRVVLIITGGNIDSLILQRVIERGMSAKGRSQTIAVRVKDEPSQLGFILDFLRHHGASVLDLRRSWKTQPLISDFADIEILIETEDDQHGKQVLAGLSHEAKIHKFELIQEIANPDNLNR